VDLVELTDYPAPDDRDELAFTILNPPPTGFSYSLSGPQITITLLKTPLRDRRRR